MTINSETRVAGPFDGNDSTVSFPFTFKVFDSDEVRVVAETGAVETDLELGTDYTVTLNADQNAAPGGSVVLVAPLPTGTRLTLTSALEMLQPVDLTNQSGFYPRVINNAFDRLTILIQQLFERLGRALVFPISDGQVGEVPGVAQRAGKLLAFDAEGNPTTALPIADSSTELRQELAGDPGVGGGASMVRGAVVTMSSIPDLLTLSPANDGQQASVTSYHINLLSPKGGGVFVWDASRTKSDHDGGTVLDPLVVFPADWSDQVQLQAWFDGSASTATGCWVRRLTGVPDVSCFGAMGDGIADDTIPMQTTHNTFGQLIFPEGTFRYSDLTITPYTGFKIAGADRDRTVLKCTKTGGFAIDIDGLELTAGKQWFYGIGVRDLTIEGNSTTSAILRLRKIAQSDFRDIVLKEASNVDGIALLGESIQLSNFTNVYCSQLYSYTNDPSHSPPAIGLCLKLSPGMGNSSNNNFIHCYWEGRYNETPKPISMKIGIQLLQATQNVFIGGSPEHVAEYGLYESATCNYNTFIGVGFESPDSILDILAGGHYTRFINCYSSWKARLQGRGSIVEGGFFERLEVTANGFKTKVFDVTVNQWASGAGGFFDSGVNTKWRNIYDADQAAFIYPNKPHTVLTMGTSPYTYTNDTGEYRQIVLNGGTVTSIVARRNGNDFNVPAGSVSATLLAPGDSMVITHTAAPTRFWSIPMNGMND